MSGKREKRLTPESRGWGWWGWVCDSCPPCMNCCTWSSAEWLSSLSPTETGSEEHFYSLLVRVCTIRRKTPGTTFYKAFIDSFGFPKCSQFFTCEPHSWITSCRFNFQANTTVTDTCLFIYSHRKCFKVTLEEMWMGENDGIWKSRHVPPQTCRVGQSGQYLWGLIRDSHTLPLCVHILKVLGSLAALHSDKVAAMFSSWMEKKVLKNENHLKQRTVLMTRFF